MNKTSYSEDYSLRILERNVTDLCWPCWSRKKDGGPPQSPRHKLTKLHNYAHKTLQQFIQTDKSNNKAHTLTIKLANNSDISLEFCLFLTSVVLASMASYAESAQAITCNQALFLFRSVKHSGGKGETKNRAWYNSSTERLPPTFWLIDIQQNSQSKFLLLARSSVCKFPITAIRKKSRKCRQNKKIIGYDISSGHQHSNLHDCYNERQK